MSLEQLNAMTDLELDEACALAHGWDEVPHGRDEKVWDTGIGDFIYNYHPTQDTTEGKSACFDLMVKYEDIYTSKELIKDKVRHVVTAYGVIVENKNLQRAICEAVMLSAQEK